jgi:protein-ribulosamine 3-kinase
MTLPVSLQRATTSFLRNSFSADVSITNFETISGGCINHGGRLYTTHGTFFLKWNSIKQYPGMFDAESKGLKLLASTKSFYIPEVLGVFEDDIHQALLLAFVREDNPEKNFWQQFGRNLASLHRHSNSHVGLDHNNYIGSLQQHNTPHESWLSFFMEMRLNVQLRFAVEHHDTDPKLIHKFESFFTKLPDLISDEKPSLLHGDLWRGNLITSNSAPCLIDPAVYFGHREMDLAMTQLFGGFDPIFLNCYEEVFPLQPGWRDRLEIYNLYPLLVHFNLFGNSYLPQIFGILNRFS